MKSPCYISPRDGKLYDRKDVPSSLKDAFAQIDKWALRPTRYIMNKADWDDIVKYSKGE